MLDIDDTVFADREATLAQRLETKNITPHIVAPFGLFFECNACGKAWTARPASLYKTGRKPNGYWKCPSGCNANV